MLIIAATACNESESNSNNPPNTPSNSMPGDNATNVDINTGLSWTGGDVDGDTVTYDVYLGASETFANPVAKDQSASTYNAKNLSYGTHYYWKIVATDNQGLKTEGPVWNFITIAASSNHTAVMETSMGTIKFEIYEDDMPTTAANFINLANSGFYDGLIFHRVVDDFVIQTGDPMGTGYGGSDTTIPLEINTELKHDDGAVGMARSMDPDSATSQFYICDGAQHGLDGNYAVFGQVTEGIDVVRAIAAVPVDSNDKPLQDIVVTQITIEE